MTFVAPAAPSPPFYIGKGLLGNNGVQIDIFGHVLPNDLSSEVSDNLTAPFAIVNPTTIFDVSGLTENHEVPVVLYVSPNDIFSAVTYTFSWYRKRDNKLLFKLGSTLADPAPNRYPPGVSMSAWIGWLANDIHVSTYPQYREIQENGDYYVTISASGGESFSQDVDFVVSGIPANTYAVSSATDAFDWVVRLSDYFDTSNYLQAGICSDPFTDGQSSAPTGILDSVTAPASNTGCATNGTVSGVTAGTTYTLYGFAQAADGNYYQAGTFEITVSGRPPLFAWDVPKISGEEVYITADEWNALANNIDEMYTYLGDTPSTFTEVFVDDDFTADIYNELLVAIFSLDPPVNVPFSASSGDDIEADMLNGLVNSINSIT